MPASFENWTDAGLRMARVRYRGASWDACGASEAPVITHPHFTGTGTRTLQDNSRKAIEELFDRSFQASPAS